MEENKKMKINRSLIVISMVIISLLAIGAVSASENVSDVIETADFDEVVAVDDNIEDSVAIEDVPETVVAVENDTGNSDILSVESEKEPIVANVEENETIKDSSSNNRFDWTTLYGKNGTSNYPLVLDFSGFLGKNTTGSSFFAFDLNNTDGENILGNAYLILGLSGIIGGNATDDSSYLALGLSGILDDNNTDNSFLVLNLPNIGVNDLGNSTLIIDLTNLLAENSTSKGSFLSIGDSDNPLVINLSGIYENGKLLGHNVTDYFDLSNFTSQYNLNLTEIFKGNLTSLVNSVNLTDLFNSSYLTSFVDGLNLLGNFSSLLPDLSSFNMSSLIGDLNLTNLTSFVGGLNFTDLLGNVSSLLSDLSSFNISSFNMSSLVDGLNLTDLLGNFSSLLSDLSSFNMSSLVSGLNLTDLLGNFSSLLSDLSSFNMSSLVSGVNLTDVLGNFSSLLSDLSSFNASSLIDGLNVTSLINNINWTSIIGGNTGAKDNSNPIIDINFDWSSIFGGKDKAEPIATIFTVEPKFTRVANDYYAGERGGMFYAKLTDINGNPLVNKSVQIASFGRIYNVVTDEQGRAGLRISYLAANTYSYAISFQGDSKYKASPIAASKLVVTKKKTSISAVSKKFKAKTKKKIIKVTLKTVKNPYNGKTYLKAGKKLTLKIKGKTYTAKINKKGVAKFTIKLTKKGKFKALIKFAGDKTYKACSKSVLIKIK